MFTDFVGFVQTVKIYDAGVSEAWVAFDVDLPRNNLAWEQVIDEHMLLLAHPFHVVLSLVKGGYTSRSSRNQTNPITSPVGMVWVTR